jgi:hypothetical protein
MDEIGNSYKISIGKPEGKRSLQRPWHRWNKIKMDLNVKECGFDSSGSG